MGDILKLATCAGPPAVRAPETAKSIARLGQLPVGTPNTTRKAYADPATKKHRKSERVRRDTQPPAMFRDPHALAPSRSQYLRQKPPRALRRTTEVAAQCALL